MNSSPSSKRSSKSSFKAEHFPAEEVIERALEFLSAQEGWLADNPDEIAAQVQEGWDEAQRGDLADADNVRAEMRQFKEDWKKQRRPHEPLQTHPEG